MICLEHKNSDRSQSKYRFTSASRSSLPCSTKLHHCRPCEQFRHRTKSKQSATWIDRSLALHIGVAVTLLEQHLTVLDDHDHRACYITTAQRVGHVAVQPCRYIFPRQRYCARRRDARACLGQSKLELRRCK